MDIASSLLCVVGVALLLGMIFLASAIRVVPEYKRLRVYRLGRDIGDRGPGVVLLIPVIDKALVVDLNSPVIGRATSLVGMVGEAQTSVHATGTVLVDNQSWDATSDYLIAPKSRIRVKRVVLEVEDDPAS